MARAKTGNGGSNGGANGTANGAANGPPSLHGRHPFDTFAFMCAQHRAQLQAQVWCVHAGADQRSIGGRLGPIDLDPVETLEERIVEWFGGPRLIIVRARFLNGQYAWEGELPIDARVVGKAFTGGPSTHAGGMGMGGAGDATTFVLQKLLDRIEKLETRESQGAPRRTQTEELKDLAGILKDLKDPPTTALTTALATPASMVKDVKETIEAVKSLGGGFGGDDVFAVKALDTAEKIVNGVGSKILEGIYGLIAMKTAARAEEKKQREQQQSEPTPAAPATEATP